MPYANNRGVHIYYEVEGQGRPIIMAHGVTGYLGRWREIGLADALKKDHRLILFDARGHGKSDKPHDPAAYGIKMIGDVIAVLDACGLNKATYWGYSMGAGVGLKAAVAHPERFDSFILGGWSPYSASAGAPPTAPSTNAPQVGLLRTDPEAFLRSREQQLGRPLTPEERKAQLANDPEALGALMVTFRDVATLSDEDLEHIAVGCLLYAGDADPFHAGAKEAANHIPGAAFFSLPGLNHVQAGASPLVLPHVKEFLARVNRS